MKDDFKVVRLCTQTVHIFIYDNSYFDYVHNQYIEKFEVEKMAQMLMKKPEKENINITNSVIIKRSNRGLKILLKEAIESSRFEMIFNYRCGRCKINV